MTAATTTTLGEIVLSGDLTGTAALPELRASGVTPGTYSPVQKAYIDSKGRITWIGQLTADGLSSALDDATTSTKGQVQIGDRIAVSGGVISHDPGDASEVAKGVMQIDTTVPVGRRLPNSAGEIQGPGLATADQHGEIIVGSGLSVSSGTVSIDTALVPLLGSTTPAIFSKAVGVAPTTFEVIGAATMGATTVQLSTTLTTNNHQLSGNTFNTAVPSTGILPASGGTSAYTCAIHANSSVFDVAGISSPGVQHHTSANDGLSWSSSTAFTGSAPVGIASGVVKGGSSMAILTRTTTGTTSQIYVNPTGSAWTTSALPSTNFTTGRIYNGLAYGNGVFCVIGHGSTSGVATLCATSPTGSVWTARTVPTFTDVAVQGGNYNNIIWTGSVFMAVGKTSVSQHFAYATSADGTTWTSGFANIASTEGVGIAWNGTNYFATTDSTSLVGLSSPDGVTWTSRTIPGSGALNPTGVAATYTSVASNGSGFVAVATNGDVATSADGITWSYQTNLGNGTYTAAIFGYKSIAWNGTKYCAVTSKLGGSYQSADGVTWEAVLAPGGGATLPATVNFTLPSNTGQIVKATITAQRELTLNFGANALVETGSVVTQAANTTSVITLVGNGTKWLVSTDAAFS